MSTNTPAGKFIVLEGTDGAGKTTQLQRLTEALQAKGIDLVVTREPGGTAMAEQIREVILGRRDEAVDPMTELLLMFAARRQHLNQVIRPALAAGKWVLCDRFIESSYAFQVVGGGVAPELFYDLTFHVVEDTAPDWTFILDVPDEVGMARSELRGNLNRLDELALEKRQRINESIRSFQHFPKHSLINGDRPVEEITLDLITQLTPLIQEHENAHG